MPALEQPPFDPMSDLPPAGAEVTLQGRLFRYDGVKGRWRIEESPIWEEVGGIAWPFSDRGSEIAQAYAETIHSDDQPLGQR